MTARPRPQRADGPHPDELELRHYARGSLAPGHAIAVLAHCVVCALCGERLERLLAHHDAGQAGRLRQPGGRGFGGS